MTIRINLLPHREERRKRARTHFIALTGLTAVLGLVIVGAVHVFFANRIAIQDDRNAFLKTQIAQLDKQINEIKKLRDEIQALLARKQVIETLQADRAQTVHLMSE
ncbi:MAG TPA: fimbrial assembly protein, partial [Burkholderiales bacterium]|nr:fimbrial assembly protein [Burkholderiales bacterium]